VEHDVSKEARNLVRRQLPANVESETFAVVLYHVERLEKAGMDPVYAVAIAVSEEADWRLAERMKSKGATDHETAEVIL
jgi:hypothetical protein